MDRTVLLTRGTYGALLEKIHAFAESYCPESAVRLREHPVFSEALEEVKTVAKTRAAESLAADVVAGYCVHLAVAGNSLDYEQWAAWRGLRPEVQALLLEPRLREHVRGRMEAFCASPAHECLLSKGILSATLYQNLYLGRYGPYIETPVQAMTRVAAGLTVAARPEYYAALGLPPGDQGALFDVFFEALTRLRVVVATPAFMNLGTAQQKVSSCFLINRALNTPKQAGDLVTGVLQPIMNEAGGIGMNLTPGFQDHPGGMLEFLRYLEASVRYTNLYQRRRVGVNLFLEPWHASFHQVLNIRTGEEKLENLHTTLWMPDLLMERYLADPDSLWSFFGSAGDGLRTVYGERFKELYEDLEARGLAVRREPVREVLFGIIKTMLQTGEPSLMWKDACNRHYFGPDVLQTSNLCTEILQRSDQGVIGACNLANVNLNACLLPPAALSDPDDPELRFDFGLLRRLGAVACVMGNCMMDGSDCAFEEARRSMREDRSLGIGVQGLADVVAACGWEYTSPPARRLNRLVFEALQLGAVACSVGICRAGAEIDASWTPIPHVPLHAQDHPPPGARRFDGFPGSFYARGLFHHETYLDPRPRWPEEWERLRADMLRVGIYNSQLTALMPTVSTSCMTGSSESFYPFGDISAAHVSGSGQVPRVNAMLFAAVGDDAELLDVLRRNDWQIPEGPAYEHLRIYRAGWTYPQDELLEMAADRAPWVDHSQSQSVYIIEPGEGAIKASTILALIVRGFKLGLKTGCYYLKFRKATRTRAFCLSCSL